MKTTPIPLYHVDAFTNRLFAGNPATVCLLEQWLPDKILQAIAIENNQRETAFLVPQNNDYHIRWFSTLQEVQTLKPEIETLAVLEGRGIIITAPGDRVDFVSRYFSLKQLSSPEDAVTGSAHCSSTPYWAERLGKKQLTAKQLSLRGGDLLCEWRGDRILLKGQAVLYLQGTISL